MSILENKTTQLFANDIKFSDEMMYVFLQDGREIGIPLSWFPKLFKASKEELNNWRFIGDGLGVHWNTLDEDISINALLR
ncbi:MAG: DUF2442 domain-containing protein [Ilyomonas sp.]